jgi:mono/diheme cytochrome c family protein
MGLNKNFHFLKKGKSVAALSIFASLVCLVLFQNCSLVSPANGLNNSGSGDLGSLSEAQISNQKALAFLDAKCSSCHSPQNPSGDISDITNLDYLLFYRLVIPGQPDISDLIRVIKEGSMPPTGSITNEELDMLNNWILKDLADDGGGVTIPGTSAQLEAKFSSLQARIFSPKCVGCHNATKMDGGANLSTYAGVMNEINNGKLIPSIERAGANYMPRGGARLSADELSKMKLWIQDGAMNN